MRTLLLVLLAAPSAVAADRPNVLFVMVDDLRPELGCYGAEHVRSPNVDRLAASGVLFERAHCQQAVCNPSRTSLMTGRRPDRTGVTTNHAHFRDAHPDIVTLPQHFKESGYHSQSIGKLYHGVFPDGTSRTKWDTMGDPPSWSVPTTRFGPRYYYTEEGIAAAQRAYLAAYRPTNPGPDDWTTKLVFGPMTEAPDVADETLYDGKVATAAIEALRERAARPDVPFLLAVGFIKPHTPFVAPRRYWDAIDPSTIPLAERTTLPDRAPALAGHGSGEVRRYTDQPKRGPFTEANQRRLRHGYLACVGFVDAQIGRLLDELERLELADDTIVVLLGDHGWHLGEHGLWGKTTNFELDTRVPLIVRAPGGLAGHRTDELVELVDLYPTLCDLAGLDPPKNLDGNSFAETLADAEWTGDGTALSQYPRGRTMGYSLRTERWRYTEWIDRGDGRAVARELYDYTDAHPVETQNVAADHPDLVRAMSAQLHDALALADPESNTADEQSAIEGPRTTWIEKGKPGDDVPTDWTARDGHVEATGTRLIPITTSGVAEGDFHLRARLRMQNQQGSAASFFLDDNHFGFEGNRETFYLNGPVHGGLKLLGRTTDVFERGAWIDFEAIRRDGKLSFRVDGRTIHTAEDGNRSYRRIGFAPWRSTMQIASASFVGKLVAVKPPPARVDVFVQGKEPGYPRVRIPAIVTTNKGTLLAFAEGRAGGDHSGNDIILKRSTDGGRSWGKLHVVHEAGDVALNNPQPVVLDSGRVLLIYQRNKHGERNVKPGFAGPDVGYTLLQHSDDDGQTWSKPRDITRGVKRGAPVSSHASGPGVGIVLRRGEHAGRIVMPFNQGPFGRWKVYAAYSDDNGDTWQYGDVAPEDATGKGVGNEVQMVELADGSILLNTRVQGGTKHRKTARSTDGGRTWSPLRDDPTLIEPQCQASILRHAWPTDDAPGRLLFANPASTAGRSNGTLRLSTDDGRTWPVARVIEPGGFAYSCLTVLPDGDIGILFERDGYRAISFARVSLDWLHGRTDDTFLDPEPAEEAAATKRPNVLLIVSEDNGPELGCYGDHYARTPRLDALAGMGTRFGNAFVPYSVCSPSRAALFTGRYPHRNGQIGLATHRFAMYREWPNLVGVLKEAGYRTGIIGKIHVNPESAFPCDFRAFPGSNFGDRPVAKFAERAGDFMQEGDDPFLLMVNFPDAHFPLIRQQHGLPAEPLNAEDVKPLPWVGVDSPRLREFTANYYNCMERLDTGVGLLLDELAATGHDRDTLVVYLGDHGAQFSRGKTSVYEAGLRVPLIVRLPGESNDEPRPVADELVSTIDLFPTILDVVGLDVPETVDGRSLLPAIRGEADAGREHIVAMTTGAAPALYYPQFSIRDERYKLIVSPQRGRENASARAYLERYNQHFAAGCSAEEIAASPPRTRTAYARYLEPPPVELYDLANDPHEFENLADDAEHTDARRRLEAALAAWRDEYADPFAHPTVLARLTAEHDDAPARDYRKSKSFRWEYLDYAPRAATAPEGVTLARVFDDHAVLQRDQPQPVWGRAPPGETVSVRIANRTATTRADAGGDWRVTLEPLAASADPIVFEVRGTTSKSAVRLEDVLVGEVWIAAGQSNMEWPLAKSADARAEIAAADHPAIRLLHLEGAARGGGEVYTAEQFARMHPETFFGGRWARCTPESAADFSAVAYQFAARLHDELGVPVGVVCPAMGGSPCVAWIRRGALADDPRTRELVQGNWLENDRLEPWCRSRAKHNLGAALNPPGNDLGPYHSFAPGYLWEAGVAPLVPYAIRGVLWYQGESNAESDWRVAQHADLFRRLVHDWRDRWGRDDLPFGVVQLPAMGRPHWPAFRDQQRRLATELDDVGLIVTLDTGHPTNVHPTDKRPVGERLARWALATQHDVDLPPTGPLLLRATRTGNELALEFASTGGRLRTTDGEPPRHLAISLPDGTYRPVTARFDVNRLVVDLDTVDGPTRVRYAWEPFPKPAVNLVGADGLPASPFEATVVRVEE